MFWRSIKMVLWWSSRHIIHLPVQGNLGEAINWYYTITLRNDLQTMFFTSDIRCCVIHKFDEECKVCLAYPLANHAYPLAHRKASMGTLCITCFEVVRHPGLHCMFYSWYISALWITVLQTYFLSYMLLPYLNTKGLVKRINHLASRANLLPRIIDDSHPVSRSHGTVVNSTTT